MDNEKDDEQYAVRIVDSIEKDIQINICISLTKTGHYLNEHEKKENGIHDLEEFLFHSKQV